MIFNERFNDLFKDFLLNFSHPHIIFVFKLIKDDFMVIKFISQMDVDGDNSFI